MRILDLFAHGPAIFRAGRRLSALPVLLFLLALQFIDTYKLVTRSGACCGRWPSGGGAALVCYALNTAIYARRVWCRQEFGCRSGAPVIEEIAGRPLYVVWLLRAESRGLHGGYRSLGVCRGCRVRGA